MPFDPKIIMKAIENELYNGEMLKSMWASVY